MLYKTIDGTIGNTPLVELTNIEKDLKLDARIYGKIEAFNPAGSVKDRIAKAMIDDLEEKGILKEDSVIIEPTSGNTGIALSSIATARGYRAIIVMPETMSIERRKLIKAYGAKLVLTEGAKGMKGAVAKAEELSKTISNAVIPGQFINPANPATHYRTTGPEIYRDLDGKVDIFVAGVAVPKTGQKLPSPREDATEASVGRVAVPKTGQKTALPRDNLYPMGHARFPCARKHRRL